jgi:AcrR family transcriptional regulator
MTAELRNKPQQARSRFTLDCITEAAKLVVAEHGYDRITTERVAKRAGVSIGTVYRYFPDRIALLDAIDSGRRVAADVRAERARQDAKWGEQNHPNGTGPDSHPLADFPFAITTGTPVRQVETWTASEIADAAKANCEIAADQTGVTWTDILLEEVFEALAEDDPAKLRTELVQVAAVAQQWVEAIDRRAS